MFEVPFFHKCEKPIGTTFVVNDLLLSALRKNHMFMDHLHAYFVNKKIPHHVLFMVLFVSLPYLVAY